LTNKLVEIVTQIQQGVIAHGADAMNLVLQSIKIGALGNFLAAIGSIVGVYIIYKIYPYIRKLKSEDPYDMTLNDFLYWLYCACSAVFTVIVTIGVFCQFFDVWQYIAIFNPKLYLAHEIIEKVMK
jgi:hypothetical protein